MSLQALLSDQRIGNTSLASDSLASMRPQGFANNTVYTLEGSSPQASFATQEKRQNWFDVKEKGYFEIPKTGGIDIKDGGKAFGADLNGKPLVHLYDNFDMVKDIPSWFEYDLNSKEELGDEFFPNPFPWSNHEEIKRTIFHHLEMPTIDGKTTRNVWYMIHEHHSGIMSISGHDALNHKYHSIEYFAEGTAGNKFLKEFMGSQEIHTMSLNTLISGFTDLSEKQLNALVPLYFPPIENGEAQESSPIAPEVPEPFSFKKGNLLEESYLTELEMKQAGLEKYHMFQTTGGAYGTQPPTEGGEGLGFDTNPSEKIYIYEDTLNQRKLTARIFKVEGKDDLQSKVNEVESRDGVKRLERDLTEIENLREFSGLAYKAIQEENGDLFFALYKLDTLKHHVIMYHGEGKS